VLLLRFQEELGLAEIAAVLGAPISTVKSRLYRGLAELRGLLAEKSA
jgi:RNA polymerase sigma-70 factor (ECF subfamily)